MKKTIIVILVLLTSIGVNAQSLFWDGSDADAPITLGARFGWNFGSIAGKGSNFYDGRNGFALGAAVDVNLIKSFSINTGLYFTMKGYSLEYEVMDDKGMVSEKGKRTWAMNFLEIPVYASYHLRFSPETDLQIFAGPYFDLGVYGKLGRKERQAEIYNEKEVHLFNKSQGFNRWQAGIGLGASYTFGGHYLVAMQYQWGITDVAELIEQQLNLFQISIGYNF